MPEMTINGCRYFYEDQGSGDQVIFWGHGLMYSWQSFKHQISYFAQQGYRCIALDWRGQGASGGGGEMDDYSLYRLGDDAAQLLAQLDIPQVHWVGLSMGGMVGLRLFLRQPTLFRSMVLIDTSASDAPELLPKYRQMAETYRAVGAVPPLIEALDHEFYTPGFAQRQPDEAEYWHNYWRNADRESLYKAVLPVIERDDVTESVHTINVPTMIIVGAEDEATPPEKSRILHEKIAGSEILVIPNASHMSCVEQPESVTKAIASFLHKL